MMFGTLERGGFTNTRDMLIAVTAVGLTIAAGLVALNLREGEKQIDQTIARLYDAEDPHFGRAKGLLLGPAILDGQPLRGTVERRRDLSGDAMRDPRCGGDHHLRGYIY
jgi:hypothetical protein